MTGPRILHALSAGAEQVALWSQLLDRINVFPVADGDTGRNLVISLAPLRQDMHDPAALCQSLLLAARGNSGNIAARFLQELAPLPSLADLPAAVQRGRDMAYGAVSQPKPGTMLSLFDRLAGLCRDIPADMSALWAAGLLAQLEKAVADTVRGQEVLQQAGVVDAGALGMYLFFEGFFSRITGTDCSFSPVRACFKNNLRIAESFSLETTAGFCIDAVVQSAGSLESALGRDTDSAVVMRSGDYIKVHLHAADREKAKAELAACGKIITWADDDLTAQTRVFARPAAASAVHIMTDAAGSITREDAAELGITLLDSYITMGDRSLPETCFCPDEVYRAMGLGCRCSTAQASVDERHRHYSSVLEEYTDALYLCVGSVYTGNYQAACGWKKMHDPAGRLSIIDTGAASGRLAVAVHLAARFARQAAGPAEVEAFLRKALSGCHEYIFLDTLKYLAAGGRLSKTGAFVGDMLKFKPIISPQPDGAQKVGMVRNRDEQMRFAMDKLSEFYKADGSGLILLEYTDNRPWVEDVASAIQARFPKAGLLLRPLSLTSGVHMGPGTWGVAFATEE